MPPRSSKEIRENTIMVERKIIELTDQQLKLIKSMAIYYIDWKKGVVSEMNGSNCAAIAHIKGVISEAEEIKSRVTKLI